MRIDAANPLPVGSLNVGIDIEDVGRFEPGGTSLDSPIPEGVFTPDEHAHCQASANPAVCYAVHWCAKEAGVKALWPWVRLDPRRLSLRHDEPGGYLLLIDEAPTAIPGIVIHISVSSTVTTAVAVVLAAPAPNL